MRKPPGGTIPDLQSMFQFKEELLVRTRLPLRVIPVALIFVATVCGHAERKPLFVANPNSVRLLEEHFTTATGSTPPTGWTSRTIAGVASDVWRFDNPGNRPTGLSASAPFAGFDSDFQSSGGGPEDVALESPAFSPQLNATIVLQFTQYFRSNPYGTSAVVEAFNGTMWSPVDSTSLDSPDGEAMCIDITNEVAGVANARIRFRFRGDYSWWWFVDDVVITEIPIAPAHRVLFENFSTANGTTPPAGWTQNRIAGASWDLWHFDNPAQRLIVVPMARQAALFDSDSLSRLGGPEDVALESPAFSTSATSLVQLRFHHSFRGGSNGMATVEVFNGTSWVERWRDTSSSRNPDTVAVNITNECAGVSTARVRFRWRGDWAWWWIVDNVEILETPNSTTEILSDTFNGSALNTALWTFENPVGDASFAMTGTDLAITVPAGATHDITEAGNFAPRMMQRVNNPQDFELNVKFDGLMNQQFQMQGVQIRQDSSNFLRLEFYSDGSVLHRLAWSFVNGTHEDMGGSGLLLGSATPLYMRIQRHGDAWTQSWSTDGITYNPGTTFNRAMTVTAVGVYAANAGYPPTSSPAFTGLIDYFLVAIPLPVQLSRFTAVQNGPTVRLEWTTLTEHNTLGFEVQKSHSSAAGFVTLPNSFVPGHGTTSEPHDYVWIDSLASSGTWYYRLKQIEQDGTLHYSDAIRVDILTGVAESAPCVFALHQNYPNPFNPSTQIRFSVESTGPATLEIYNVLGQKVATLFAGIAESGRDYTLRLDASDLATGMYLYKLTSGARSEVKRMLLVR